MGQVTLQSSFRKTANSVMQLRSSGVLSFVGTSREVDVARAVQSLTAINMQMLGGILGDKRCWAYLIAFDAATRSEELFIDVRVRMCTGDKL